MWSGCTFSWTMRESLFIFFVCSAWLVRYFSFGIFLPYSLKMHPNSWKASKKNRDMWFMTKNLKAFWYHTTGLAKHTKFPHSVSWSLEERKKILKIQDMFFQGQYCLLTAFYFTPSSHHQAFLKFNLPHQNLQHPPKAFKMSLK